jgi:hypothetical protein
MLRMLAKLVQQNKHKSGSISLGTRHPARIAPGLRWSLGLAGLSSLWLLS